MSITKDPAKKNPSQPSARETQKDQPLHSAKPEQNKSPSPQNKNPNPSNPHQKEKNAWK